MARIRKTPNRRHEARYRAQDGTERAKRFATKRDTQAFLDRQGVARQTERWRDPRSDVGRAHQHLIVLDRYGHLYDGNEADVLARLDTFLTKPDTNAASPWIARVLRGNGKPPKATGPDISDETATG